MNIRLPLVGLVLFAILTSAKASPVDVSYSVSGSPGNWILDFSVADNLGGTNDIYFFGVRLPSANIVATPTGWFQPSASSLNWSIYGGSNTEYNKLWITCPAVSCPVTHPVSVIGPGRTLGGFRAVDSDVAFPMGISWFAVAAGGTYRAPGPGCSFICNAPFDNPGFEGTATVVPVAPSAILFGSAVGLFGWFAGMRRSVPGRGRNRYLRPHAA